MRPAQDVASAKAELRAQLLAGRRSRSADELEAARAQIRAHALAACAGGGWTCVAAYEPMRTEPGSRELLAALVHAGVRVLVPLTLPYFDLDWMEWGSSAPLGKNAIATADAVLVPALAVARDGTRLGRGRGCYDRALARCRDDVALLALIFDEEFVATLPRDRWDLPLDGAIAPSGQLTVERNVPVAPRRWQSYPESAN